MTHSYPTCPCPNVSERVSDTLECESVRVHPLKGTRTRWDTDGMARQRAASPC